MSSVTSGVGGGWFLYLLACALQYRYLNSIHSLHMIFYYYYMILYLNNMTTFR
jgi:hypothetical protein